MKSSTIISFYTLLLAGVFSTLVASAPAAQAQVPTFTTLDGRDAGVDILGPGSYEELQGIVEGRKLHKRAVGGVYLCDLPNFGQPCYYAVYPLAYDIRPDPYWAARISSVGPDVGTRCTFSNSMNCAGTTHSFTTPGGNLPSGINNNLKCFRCGVGPTMIFPRMPAATAQPEIQDE